MSPKFVCVYNRPFSVNSNLILDVSEKFLLFFIKYYDYLLFVMSVVVGRL